MEAAVGQPGKWLTTLFPFFIQLLKKAGTGPKRNRKTYYYIIYEKIANDI
jgi:hypothetical protein